MSVKNFLDADDFIASIRLQRKHPLSVNKVWVVVEGKTDWKLFSKLLDGDDVIIEIAYGGVKSLLKGVEALLKETDRILGIRDADFLHMEGKTESGKNIFLTDYHDVEMMLISCDITFRSVTAEYLGGLKEVTELRQKILASIAFLGGLRWLNDSEILELNFQGIDFGVFYNGETISLDEEQCLNETINRSPKRKRDISREEVRSKISNVIDFLNLCNGHDFQKAFARRINCYSQKGISDEKVGEAFRLSYTFDVFQKTNLYRSLKEFADNHEMSLFTKD